MLTPEGVNVRWSMGLVSDQLANGRRFVVMSVVDDFSRECVLQVVDYSLSCMSVAYKLKQLAEYRALPRFIVCGYGPQFAGDEMSCWSQDSGVKLQFIHTNYHTQTTLVERFSGLLREYCLDLNWFASIDDAKATISGWRRRYNEIRPQVS
jgi:putative transposase